MMETGAASPCIKLCVLDPVSGFCIGCGRSGEEIGQWLQLSPAERIALNAQLPARLRQMTSRAARGGRRGRLQR